ncbi:branched-chain amino acid transporter permease [Undibacterium sp. Ren11W]|uniref:branched-chain amino acid transporter permease n=1 Tax=Undibacterium sp. Ren11W TaxID=3413045 RepID=UPI003BF2D60B
MKDANYILGVIAAMGLVTFALRALPFVAARWLNKHPMVQRLGQFLPLGIMTLLLVHAMAGSAHEHAGGPWPELLAIAVVAILQWYRNNALFSIVVGTSVYVLIRNLGIL